jgi:hypothetical protein
VLSAHLGGGLAATELEAASSEGTREDARVVFVLGKSFTGIKEAIYTVDREFCSLEGVRCVLVA